MNLSHIPNEVLEQIAQLTPAKADAELAHRQQQNQVLTEVQHYIQLTQEYSTRLDQLIPEYQMRYQDLAGRLAGNPESALVPELASLYQLTQEIERFTNWYIQASLYSGNITDPFITDRLGKPVRGRAEIDRWLNTSGELGRQMLKEHLGTELEKRTGRKALYSFPEPFDSRSVAAQREILATAVLVAQGKR